MNDILDNILIKIIFLIIISALIFIYKIGHILIYPSQKKIFIHHFNPAKSPCETLILFSRILGIGIIFANFKIYLSNGFLLASLGFIITAVIVFFLYLLGIYILESIVLSDFEYSEEITRKGNIPYALVSSSFSIGLPFIFQVYLNQSMNDSSHNLVYILLMWSISLVLLGFSVKAYPFVSKMNFQQLLINKNLALGFSYSGFFLSCTLIISSALDQEIVNIKAYALSVLLKIILSLMIFPIFRFVLMSIFKFKIELEEQVFSYGVGMYEGFLLLSSAFMTTLITSNLISTLA